MSSFVIKKQEFAKAAGLLYGIESTKRFPHKYFLDHVRENFVRCYELNVASVNEQYREEIKVDPLDYDALFERYKYRGTKIYYGMGEQVHNLQELTPLLWKWFESVLYQIENDEMHKQVSAWFFVCFGKLYERNLDCEGWWGEIEI